jgi:hypothetical protein
VAPLKRWSMDKELQASQAPAQQAGPHTAAFISCDIVGHSAAADSQVQLDRVAGINSIIATARRASDQTDLLWASGGDGGHAIFCQRNWHQSAVALALELRRWALREKVPLRITAHYGPIYEIPGADGRVQPVGDGINMAGWILSRGSNSGMIASIQFKTEVEKAQNAGVRLDVQFHDPRMLQSKSLLSQELYLMSSGSPQLKSQWEDPSETDRRLLHDASEGGSAWDVVYYAKRLLQLHTPDPRVEQAIQKLGPAELITKSDTQTGPASRTNPFLGHLDWLSLYEIIQLGELIERQYNEVICRYGDSGSTMFIILRGQIGVFKPGGQDIEGPARPAFTLGAGEIVGELAFALRRDRTADLVSLGETALLSFNYREVEHRLARLESGADAKRSIDRFMTSRILEHTCHQLPYMIGKDRSGPLTLSDPSWGSWENLLQRLLYSAEVLSCPDDSEISIDELEGLSERNEPGGIYILVGGVITYDLKSAKGSEARTLRGLDFPLLHVNLPGKLAIPGQQFEVAEAARILKISSRGIAGMPAAVRNRLIADLKREVRKSYPYDVFLSYNVQDRETIERWRAALEEAGLRVYHNVSRPLTKFLPEIEEAVLRSLTFLAFVSSHTVTRSSKDNWVIRESKFRQEQFSGNACILPIILAGGRADVVASGFSPVEVSGNEPEAIRIATEAIQDIKLGKEEAPFGKSLRSDVRL